jgi:valyl-tRNA synthetase
MGKISKSRGGGPVPPMEMIETYSADAVRYWAASTGLGKDAVISEAKIQLGARLVNKLWNVARFAQPFLKDTGPNPDATIPPLSPADRWILSRAQRLIRAATHYMRDYEHAAAKSEIEAFFWTELADNYIEMAKLRLYASPSETESETAAARPGAQFALRHTLLTVLKLFAPFLPHVTERIYQALFAAPDHPSIHVAPWPVADPRLEDDAAEKVGAALVSIATAVRRYKSEHNLPLGDALQRIELSTADRSLYLVLHEARADVASIARAEDVRISEEPHLDSASGLVSLQTDGPVAIALLP